MSDVLANRAVAIRHYLDALGREAVAAHRYSLVAARWEALRLAQHRGKTTPAQDARLRELGVVMGELAVKIGFSSTPPKGFLPCDPCRIICRDWVEAAELWW